MSELKISHLMGLMAGIGVGLIFGGMVGYVSKGSAIRQEQKRQEIKQLRKEKEELEKQAAGVKKTTEQKATEDYIYKNPQSF